MKKIILGLFVGLALAGCGQIYDREPVGVGHFLGQPIDYIAFTGLCEKNTVDEILLIEVKTNTSQLSGREKEIREAVKSGRIRYVEYRIN